jgi:hypothetical protein
MVRRVLARSRTPRADSIGATALAAASLGAAAGCSASGQVGTKGWSFAVEQSDVAFALSSASPRPMTDLLNLTHITRIATPGSLHAFLWVWPRVGAGPGRKSGPHVSSKSDSTASITSLDERRSLNWQPCPFNPHHPDAALTRRRAPALICHTPASLECNQVYVHRIGASPSEA